MAASYTSASKHHTRDRGGGGWRARHPGSRDERVTAALLCAKANIPRGVFLTLRLPRPLVAPVCLSVCLPAPLAPVSCSQMRFVLVSLLALCVYSATCCLPCTRDRHRAGIGRFAAPSSLAGLYPPDPPAPSAARPAAPSCFCRSHWDPLGKKRPVGCAARCRGAACSASAACASLLPTQRKIGGRE